MQNNSIYKQNKEAIRQAVAGEIEKAVSYLIARSGEEGASLDKLIRRDTEDGYILFNEWFGDMVVVRPKDLSMTRPEDISDADYDSDYEVVVPNLCGGIRGIINVCFVEDSYRGNERPIAAIRSITEYSLFKKDEKPSKETSRARSLEKRAARRAKTTLGFGPRVRESFNGKIDFLNLPEKGDVHSHKEYEVPVIKDHGAAVEPRQFSLDRREMPVSKTPVVKEERKRDDRASIIDALHRADILPFVSQEIN